MSITSLKYTSIDKTSIQVTLEDGAAYTAPWPCFTWHREEIQNAIDSGLEIEPFKTKEEILADAKTKVWTDIKTERDRRTTTGGYKVTVDGTAKWFHSDASSRIQQLALFQLGDSIPSDLQWKTMDGSFVTMTKELAGLIVVHASMSDQAIFEVAETHKAAALASSDPASYDYSTWWPKIFGE